MKIILILLLIVHGMIHLIGFFRDMKPLRSPPVDKNKTSTFNHSNPTLRQVSWLLASLLMLGGAFLLWREEVLFWLPIAISVLFSQTLIFFTWKEAKYGTIINLIISIAVLFTATSMAFEQHVLHETKHLLSRTSSAPSTEIAEEDLTELPTPVKKWMYAAHVIGKSPIQKVRLIQSGEMRTSRDDPWMPFTADQYITTDPPAFLWTASIRTPYFIAIAGRDLYSDGHGNMVIKAASTIPIADSFGKEIDQGTMVRYMAEVVWYPTAALAPYVHWTAIDDAHARMTMVYHGVEATGIITFDKAHLPIMFEAKRYGDFDGQFRLETWIIRTKSFTMHQGIVIANESEVSWRLPDGDFKWLKLRITDVQYNTEVMMPE